MSLCLSVGDDFNPRPVCTGRLYLPFCIIWTISISTHAPYVRGDGLRCFLYACNGDFNPRPVCTGRHLLLGKTEFFKFHFNPRPVCTGRPYTHCPTTGRMRISTHAPYVRGDRRHGGACRKHRNFNPRPVCTGRHSISPSVLGAARFQPTPRMYGATDAVIAALPLAAISTHAPYVRGDRHSLTWRFQAARFQPTPRMYGATLPCRCVFRFERYFNPRPVCTGRRIGFL